MSWSVVSWLSLGSVYNYLDNSGRKEPVWSKLSGQVGAEGTRAWVSLVSEALSWNKEQVLPWRTQSFGSSTGRTAAWIVLLKQSHKKVLQARLDTGRVRQPHGVKLSLRTSTRHPTHGFWKYSLIASTRAGERKAPSATTKSSTGLCPKKHDGHNIWWHSGDYVRPSYSGPLRQLLQWFLRGQPLFRTSGLYGYSSLM